jgi:hypothetical protein
VGGSSEQVNVASDSLKSKEFLYPLCEYHLLNNGCAPWSYSNIQRYYAFYTSNTILELSTFLNVSINDFPMLRDRRIN